MAKMRYGCDSKSIYIILMTNVMKSGDMKTMIKMIK